MIFKLKQWCEGIIIAIVICIIIEILIPDTKNKKYVKVIIGIYIMFVSLSTILEILNCDINFDKNFINNTVPTSSNIYNEKMKDVYVLGIKDKIKNDIEELGYNVANVEITVDSNYEKIDSINLKISGRKDETITEIEKISIGESKIENQKFDDIILFLKTNYLVEEEQIVINK